MTGSYCFQFALDVLAQQSLPMVSSSAVQGSKENENVSHISVLVPEFTSATAPWEGSLLGNTNRQGGDWFPCLI